jgi:hypothetical protein
MNGKNIIDRWNAQNHQLQQSLETVEALANVLIKLSQKEETH